MNKVILMGRLTRDPEIRYSQDGKRIGRYSLAVDRAKTQGNDNPGADFISCVMFEHTAEFAEKYLHKGTKIMVEGRIRTGSYDGNDGKKVYTTDVIVDRHEFCESANSNRAAADDAIIQSEFGGGNQAAGAPDQDGFMNIPDQLEEELPFG